MSSKARNSLLLALLLLVCAGIFVNRASENGRLANPRVDRTDQGAYLKYAIAMRDTDFEKVGRRNRMPLYPGFLALFMDKGETQEGFFARGKQINIWLTLGVLAVVAGIFLNVFPRHHALNLLLITAFTVFVFKAAYTQAEILYYGLTFVVFFLCWGLFRTPRWPVALLAGGLLGLAHLTKASVTPALLVFVVFYPLDALWMKWRRFRQGQKPGETKRLAARLLVTLLVSGAFLAVVFPYISNSKEMFGRYFYNVNSTFYFWCESWDDAESRTKAAGDREHWPDMPADEIPSLGNYLKAHTAGEICWRILSGISRVFNAMADSYGYLWFCLTYLGFAVWIAFCKRLTVWRILTKRPFPVLALTAYFAGYYVLIAWYSQIIQGNRFILGIFLPFLFTAGVFIATFARRLEIPLPGGRRVRALPAFNVVISIWLVVEILVNCFWRIPRTYGGS